MGNDTTANIILRLKDEFSKNLQNAGKNFESFARSVDQVGSAMSRTGMKMVAIGTTMNAPFFAAATAMSKYSAEAQNQMQRLSNETLALTKVISDAAMPTIKTFNDNFSKLVNTLKALDPVLLQNIAHWSMTVGQMLIAVGVVEIFVGKSISLISKMATGWLGQINIIIAAIAALTWAWTQHHDAFIKILENLDISFSVTAKNILESSKAMLEGLLVVSKLIPAFAGLSGSLQSGINSLSNAISGFQKNIQQALSGNGAGSQWINTTVTNMTAGAAKIKAIADKAKKDVEVPMKDLRTRFKELSYSISDSFGDAFSKIIVEGQSWGDSMKNIFKSVAESIIKDFTSTALKSALNSIFSFGKMTNEEKGGSGLGGILGMAVGSAFGPIGTGIGGALGSIFKFHNGGPIYAHGGLAPDEVPIIAQTGEGVLSRRGMAAAGGSSGLRKLNSGNSGGGGQTVVINQVIQAWDSQDVYRNRHALSQAIVEDIKNNGKMRQTMNSYR